MTASPRTSRKIFGVGLGRTGTHSLTVALKMLGIDARHHVDYPELLPAFSKASKSFTGDRLMAMCETHEAIANGTGLPYPELDRAFPGSRFILTVRETGAWLRSQNAYRTLQAEQDRDPAARQVHRFLNREIYGAEDFDPGMWRAAYERHVDAVQAYFADRPDDLLVMDICDGDGWEKLCPFLGRPVPARPFPHTNDIAVASRRAKLAALLPAALRKRLAATVHRLRSGRA
ncbi:MAG: sulfotransferase [Alphaproteobacteria bacterium]|nr:sulfotransferase [Alphaproteobacteria bacterium]